MKQLYFPALAAFLVLALPAAARPLTLDDISGFLNSFTTAQSPFVQINADGSKSNGTIFIKRPGRARFEYVGANDGLVMAGGGQVAIFDPKSNNPPEEFPLKRTPLNLILAAKVDLKRAKMVTGFGANDGSAIVEAQDPEHPEYGSIRLFFTPDPIRLEKWVITDGGGGETTVELGNLHLGGDFPDAYFNIPFETGRRLKN